MARLHQNNFATNLTSNQSAGVTTTPLNSIPSIAAPFYLAFDATNINGKYEIVDVTSKTATNVLHAATTYEHTTAEEVRMVVPAVELDAFSAIEKATSAELNTGTDDVKFATALAIAGSTLMKFSATRFKVGSLTRDLTAATGSVATTGVGFQPKAMIFIANVSNTELWSVGFTEGTGSGAIFWNGVANQIANDSTYTIVLRTANTPADQIATVAFDADGFTLSWTKRSTPTGTANIYYFAIR